MSKELTKQMNDIFKKNILLNDVFDEVADLESDRVIPKFKSLNIVKDLNSLVIDEMRENLLNEFLKRI